MTVMTIEELAYVPMDQQSPASTAKPDETLKARKKALKSILK